MERSRTSLFNIDIWLFGSVLALMVIGVFFVFSSGVSSTGEVVSNEYLKQILWVAVALGILVGLTFLNYRTYYELYLILYILFLVLLVATKLFGREVNGAQAWLGVGELGIQPSEFAKIATSIFLAKYFADQRQNMHKIRTLGIGALIIGAPVLLILSQPDLGTSLVFIVIYITMAFMAGARLRHVLFMIVVGASILVFTVIPFYFENIALTSSPLSALLTDKLVVLVLGSVLALITGLGIWGSLKLKNPGFYWVAYSSLILLLALVGSYFLRNELAAYQIKRFVIFMNPYVDQQGAGWNIIQSLNAIGSGGFFGKGFLQGTQSHLRYLPMQSTDFIFSILAEEWGFIGGLAVFTLYGIILWRALNTILKVKDPFAANLVAGLTGMLFFHMFFNVGMTMGMVPITGIPLYFLSYGGSHLVTGAITVGIIMNIYHRRFMF